MHEPYRRRLPHIMPPGETLFITFRLHGTLPYALLEGLQLEHEAFLARQIVRTPHESVVAIKQQWEARYFLAIDTSLDADKIGSQWLSDETVAGIVKEAIHYRDNRQYIVHAYTIMPNHVHLLVTNTSEHKPFQQVLGSLKANSAKRVNEYMDQPNQPFWQAESYDHIVRNAKSFERIINYILNNPVKAELAENWEDWPHTYLKYK
ncbi:REP-associated tyrosine transposase [Spirosoma agri]|uniref:Transposase IS200-like domain-containing protein n=1 Tax=Spirosoma agri TaxID=1987381 RepID=A0A6M0IMI4_9BACT|nr:transposase [Spirosoma agri]NEU69127.1 hypothetical protein [Spirosoma agri]